MIGHFDIGNVNQLSSYELDVQSRLSAHIPAASTRGVFGLGNSVSASGRILGQNSDQLINLGRSADGQSVEVRFPAAGTAYDLPNLYPPVANVPDQISVAVGDLDKVPDENGVNHDEVVVAYASGAGPSYSIRLAVLNYTGAKPDGSNPLYVTGAVASNPLVLDNAPNTGGTTFSSPTSDRFSVAIGDFDGDGQNEIALATVNDGPDGSNLIALSIFRYQHAQLTATPTLVEVTHSLLGPLVNHSYNNYFLPAISLAAGDFEGTGNQAELIMALRYEEGPIPNYPISFWAAYNVVQAIAVDARLNPTLQGQFVQRDGTFSTPGSLEDRTLQGARILALPGLFRYDPGNGYGLYRRELAVVSNSAQPIHEGGGVLNIRTYQVASDLSSITPMFNGQTLALPNGGVAAKFDATAGGLAVNANINTPLWSLATLQLQSGSLQETLTTIGIGVGGLKAALTTNIPSSCGCGGNGFVEGDNAFRPTTQAYDYDGRTVLLGAPIRITVNDLINTDFVLQEPPKHALWCESAQQPGCENTPQQLVVVSRVPTIADSLTNTQGTTFSAKSTDMSAGALGASLALSASASAETQAGIFTGKASAEVTAKAGYNFDFNKASYNSDYASRTLNETESTDNDDFVSGRFQLLDIWRYRILGVGVLDSAGQPANAFYDVVMPGPTVNFKGAGLNFDWYQPLHENGNILSYPAPSHNTFNPPDLGTYGIPCTSGTTNCTNGVQSRSGEMIPATAEFIDNTSGSIGLDYSNNTGSGNNITTQHKITTSLDAKVSYTGKEKAVVATTEQAVSVAVGFTSSNSWGTTATSDSTTTSTTGIKIGRSAISSAQAYEFFPTVYSTLDGTIKVAHAVDPLGSTSGQGFWATLYGGKPDPALNLPLRFVRNGSNWIPNTLSSRKQMRGFSVLSAALDPATGQYDILAQAPTDGAQVRLSAQVYNYSTGQGFTNCLVQFYAIQYDSSNNTEIGRRQLIGSTRISLPPRGTAPAQIIWNTAGFGPASSGGKMYRIYVDLNYDNAISEIYPPENSANQYATGLPLGLDPGQNDEGWGLATVMSSAPAQLDTSAQPVTLSFGPTPLAIVSNSGNLLTQDLSAQAGAPVELTAQVCTSGVSADPADVVVFDGDPADGNVIAWKRIYVPNPGACEATWFNWTPTSGQHDLVAAILPNSAPPVLPENASVAIESEGLTEASLAVNVP